MNNLKKWTNVFMGFSILLSFLTIILFYSRLMVVLLCMTISLVLITIVLNLVRKTIQDEIDELYMRITLLETAIMNKKNTKG